MRADTTRVAGDLARARGPIRAAVSRLSADAVRVGAAWNQAAGSIGAAGARIGLIAGLIGGIVVKKFADFEKTMVQVGAITQTLGTKDFPLLEAAARKAGATTEFTATESAKAMENLALAGLSTTEIMEALPKTLELASAASIDIATAARISASNMRAFGLEAENLGEINDVLVATQARANTTILELAEALKPVAGIARTAGVSLQDTASILAKMADQGFTGSASGVALRRALLNLASPAKKAKQALDKLGVGALDPLFTKFQKIKNAMDDLPDPNEKLALAAVIFGPRAAGPMIAAMDAGAEGLRKFSDELTAASGLAGNIAAAKIDTLSGQMNILKSVIEDVVLTTGGQLSPMFRDLVDELKAFIGTNADGIATGLAVGLKSMAVGLREAFISLGTMLPALLEVGRAMLALLKPILSLLKANPKLLGTLVALKLTGFLGLNSAILLTAKAIGTTMSVAIARLAVTVGTLRAALIGLGTAIAVFAAMRVAIDATVASAEKAIARTQAAADKRRGRRASRVGDAGNIGERAGILGEEVVNARREFKAAQGNVASAERGVEKAKKSSGITDSILGLFADNAASIAQRELDTANERAFQAGRHLRDLEVQLKATEKEIRDNPPPPPEDSGPAMDIPMTDLTERPAPPQLIRQIPPTLLDAGRNSFAQMGNTIQDAILQQVNDDLDKRRNAILERNEEIQKEILEATKENKPTGALT